MDYILERTARFSKHMDTWVMPFTHTYEKTRDIRVTGPEGEDVYVITLLYNHATPAEGITAPLVDTPVDDEVGSGCLASQWEGIDATGKIVLVKRGLCAISDKIKNAKAIGAVGVIMYHTDPGTDIPSATLSAENIGLLVPIGTIPNEVGTAWKSRLAEGEELVVTLLVDSVFEDRESWNIFSETKAGDPENVVMLGAHLDSVQAGPGVNDDGSGTAALLELMGSFKKYDGFANKVRFAWWGAEESGKIGSLKYTESLSPEEADRIRLYFNYDMIGSPEPFYHVYQTTEDDGVPAAPILEYLVSQGYEASITPFGTSSDYLGFINLGIPSSGIFTGAGAPEDPCYHQACDTVDNISWEAITVNTRAAGAVAARFALSLEGVPGRGDVSVNPRSVRGVRRDFVRWRSVVEEGERGHSCVEGDQTV